MIYKFGKFELREEYRTLSKNGVELDVEPQVFDLITYLVTNPERVISRDELLKNIWNGRIVSDSSISTRINQARNVLGDDGRKQNLIKTVHNKGFRFVGDMEIIDTTLASSTSVNHTDLESMATPAASEMPSGADAMHAHMPKNKSMFRGLSLFGLGVLATLGAQAVIGALSNSKGPNIDILAFSEGDEIVGVPGRNTLDLSGREDTGFMVGLPVGAIRYIDGPDGRSLYKLKNIQHIIGSPNDDWFRGTFEGNIFKGGEGDDHLQGYDGIDHLYGGPGNDILNGGYFVDEIFGGAGDDTIFVATDSPGDNIDGGDGLDTLNLSRFNYSGYEVNLDLGFSRERFDRKLGDFKLINVENIIGSPQDDIFHADDLSNNIDGGQGRDTLIFKSAFSEYAVTRIEDGSVKIAELGNLENTDTARNIEVFIFDGMSLELSMIK